MPLTTYQEVRPWARAIKEQALTRRMPTWHAARGFGAFTNDPTLTPFELALIASWVDGGLPPGPAARNRVASDFPGLGAVEGRRKIGRPAVTVPARAGEAIGRVRARWISGWSFEPGDPLITSATFSLADGTVVGQWVAGDRPVTLPSNSGIRISSPLRVQLRRRTPADFEQSYRARASVLRVATRTNAPARRVWTERVVCPSSPGTITARILGVRPLLANKASARIAIDRMGAPSTMIGWFRDFDPAFARTYWLARPVEFAADTRVMSDAPCEVELVLSSTARARR